MTVWSKGCIKFIEKYSIFSNDSRHEGMEDRVEGRVEAGADSEVKQ